MMAIRGSAFAEKTEVAYHEKWGYIWATAGETWTEKKQEALVAKYNSDPQKYADYLQGVQYGRKWIGQKVADCSGLVKWALAQLGMKGIYHGSNSQFNKNCYKTGKIEKGVKIPVGALIFTGNAVGAHNHVGVLVTETCVCEAKGTTAGVVHTPLSNKKWTYWGLISGVDYSYEPEKTETKPDISKPAAQPKPEKKKHTTLRRGMRGEEVLQMQVLLAKDGSNLELDGIFGGGTQSAVRSFQKRHNLVVDGIVGPKTWAELDKLM